MHVSPQLPPPPPPTLHTHLSFSHFPRALRLIIFTTPTPHTFTWEGRDVGLDGAPDGGEEGIKKLLDAVCIRGLNEQSGYCYAVPMCHAEGERKG